MIIGIAGRSYAGKSTAAGILVKKHGFVEVGLADPMKRFLQSTFDFTDQQLWGPSEERNKPDKRYPGEHVLRLDGSEPMRSVRSPDVNITLWHCDRCHGWTEGPWPAPPSLTWADPCYLTPRYALQQLGTEWGRSMYQNVWIDYALRVAARVMDHTGGQSLYDPRYGDWVEFERCVPPVGVVIADVRFRNEYDAVKAAGGKLLRIKRTMDDNVPFSHHESENGLRDVPDEAFDAVIPNNSTKEMFEVELRQAVGRLKLGALRDPLDQPDEVVPLKVTMDEHGKKDLLSTLLERRAEDVKKGRITEISGSEGYDSDIPPFLRKR